MIKNCDQEVQKAIDRLVTHVTQQRAIRRLADNQPIVGLQFSGGGAGSAISQKSIPLRDERITIDVGISYNAKDTGGQPEKVRILF